MTRLKEVTVFLFKKDVTLLTDNLQQDMHKFEEAYDVNPFCTYSTSSFTSKTGLKNTGEKLD